MLITPIRQYGRVSIVGSAHRFLTVAALIEATFRAATVKERA
jgi:hypothetical protein